MSLMLLLYLHVPSPNQPSPTSLTSLLYPRELCWSMAIYMLVPDVDVALYPV